ncbi:hypothetical protein [Gemmatimonas sp.]|uniref:hypothetical protein n=1 Tax=Gemmatimonas sp. TaxID=1962908 RepID=UPI003983B4B2
MADEVSGVTLIGDPRGGRRRAHTGGNLFCATFPGTGLEGDVPLSAYEWDHSNPAGGRQPDSSAGEIDGRIGVALVEDGADQSDGRHIRLHVEDTVSASGMRPSSSPVS